MRVLGLIPARGGSKGLPNKNILPLAGKPLITWTIEQALACKLIDKVLVSTDDENIQKIAISHCAEAPFLRPEAFAQDDSPTIDTVIHAINYLKNENLEFDILILLEPTSPLRKKMDLEAGLQQFIEQYEEVDGIISVSEIHLENPFVCKIVSNGVLQPLIESKKTINQRQQYPKVYFPYGVFYAIKVDVLLEKKTFYTDNIIPYYLERWQNYEVDDIIDFKIIESIINSNYSLL